MAGEIKNVPWVMPMTQARLGGDYEALGNIAETNGDQPTADLMYGLALQNFQEALKANEAQSSKIGIADALWHLGTLYTKMKKYDLAKENLEKCLSLSRTINYKLTIGLSYEELAKLYSKQGNHEDAYTLYKMYMQHRDSAFINDSAMRKLAEAKGRYEFIKVEDSLKFEQQLTAEKLKQQRLLAIQQQQELHIKETALKLSNQQKELNHLAFLNTEAQLLAEQSQRQEKEKQLALAEKEKALQQSSLKLKTTELILKEKEVKAQKMQRNVLVAGSLTLLIFGFVLYRNNQQRQRVSSLLEKQKMRTQIASDLHDEIGSTLTSISFFSEAVKMQLQEDNRTAINMLDKIGTNARTVVEKMKDIVWVISPKNDFSESLLTRMKAHAAELCNERNIGYQFETGEEAMTAKLDLQQRKNIYLIYKEAVHNAVKHAACDHISIGLLRNNGTINIQVQDNGKGFDNFKVNEGNGLINMKRRAEEMGADFSVQTACGKGTCIKVTMKIT